MEALATNFILVKKLLINTPRQTNFKRNVPAAVPAQIIPLPIPPP